MAEQIWWWLGLGAALLAIEAVTGTLFLLCLGVGALLTSAMVWFVPQSEWQPLVFAGSIAVAAWLWHWRRQHHAHSSSHDAASMLNNRTRHLIGRHTVLMEPVMNGRGRVNIDDSWWQATCSQDLPVGSHVRIVAVHDMIVTIIPESHHETTKN